MENLLEQLKALSKDDRDALLKAAKRAERDEKTFEDFLRVNLEAAGKRLIELSGEIRTARAKLDKAVKSGKRDAIDKAANSLKTLLSDAYLLGGSRQDGPYELRYAVCPDSSKRDYFETFFGFAPVVPEKVEKGKKADSILKASIARLARVAPAKPAKRTKKTNK